MTRRRWIADEVSGDHAALLGDNARHLAKVLRARVGQEFEVSAEGRVRLGRIVSVAEQRVEFELGEQLLAGKVRSVLLLLAIFKFDRMEWAIEKATELGVERIGFVVADRSDKHLVAATGKRLARWKRIATEAAQQARRTSPPSVSGPIPFTELVRMEMPGARIVLAESERGISLMEVLEGSSAPGVALAIGPEGGWTDRELSQFKVSSWIAASLGPTILRAETAAVAALAVTMASLHGRDPA